MATARFKRVATARFKRVAAAFDEMARRCSCESSGSEHSVDLSFLVNSFFEKEISNRKIKCSDDADLTDDEVDGGDDIDSPEQIDLRDSLSKLLIGRENNAVNSIRADVEAALDDVSGDEDGFKRRLMSRLRERGLDAGLCKSKWEKIGRNPPGNHEYIDVNSGGSRYIVEVNLAAEFTIARPTRSYAALLEKFPRIFIGEPRDLKEVVKLMSAAIRKSMKRVELNVPPWRRPSYMQAKWFGFYRRTANETPIEKACGCSDGKRLVGFVPAEGGTTPLYFGGDFWGKSGRRNRISGLAAALK